MFFEGSEKKVELVMSHDAVSLRSLGINFWSNIVAQCDAEILSSISNDHCDAYLLSESSLFVWDHHFLMLTCGTTTLVNSLQAFLDHLENHFEGQLELIESVIFQRKNEYQSHLQITSFEQDIARLQKRLKGVAFQLGNLDSHHNYIYHLDKPYTPNQSDKTFELLMYHIEGKTADYLRQEGQDASTIRSMLSLETLLPGFTIDEYVFEPFGYSMNAILGDKYATMHITPQEKSSYVSFETNLDIKQHSVNIFNQLIHLLQPSCFDIISFNDEAEIHTEHTLMNQVEQDLSCGYTMRFKEYMKQQKISAATQITL
ncbi:S-adenosylmethionine decarboxylase proenzyme, putative [Marinomonas sp. MED121]|uniref:adenosylmethionine decarboxylase n=1 Tax=Marinomonas sp. MED121 TaxID=314277 RepID=UPI000068FC1B|nr:adenosylmethionine decarboxylase [Marinomonas sp. MED121]EAQ63851.1 S-adenosylmethionine decarboxylase proenzyme, putative [Marinomonas sp. MED121]